MAVPPPPSLPDWSTSPPSAAHTTVLVELARRSVANTPWSSLLALAEDDLAEHVGISALGFYKSSPNGGFASLEERAEAVGSQSAGAGVLRKTLRAGTPLPLTDEALADLAAAMQTEAQAGLALPVTGQDPHIVIALRATPEAFSGRDQQVLHVAADLLASSRQRQDSSHALRRREAMARAILNTSVDGIITINERGAILTLNPAAERIFGYTAEEITGCNVRILMPEPYRDEHDGYLHAYRETGRRRIIGIGREVSGRRKDGSTFPMELSVSEVRAQDGTRTFTGLVRDISARRELEAEVLRIADEERRRIGQDLHDGLGQMLTGTHLIARGLARQLEADGSPHATDASELAGLIKEADGYARALARGLVPVELEAHGLAAALKRLSANAERLFDVACTFELVGSGAGDVGEAPEVPSATHLFRIAQEAVSNAVQHGRAAHITITLAVGADQVRLRIDDDGVGIGTTIRSGGLNAPLDNGRDTLAGATTRPDENRGMGVRIMHYRARIAQGSLELRPGTDGGTTVLCTVPLQ